ncbi:glycosyltransferase family 2 protein [Candidatus Giovannonibacteria bacterium]|nr:glycosyltransferase family 2 protein [Candidatus Giovannonibacteria bacterium]
MLIFFALCILSLIVLIKAKTTSTLRENALLFFYGIFVTSFQLSRLAGALLYQRKAQQDFIKPNYEPYVSVVVPCKNEEGAIEKTVLMCAGADYPLEKLELIFINDGSTDNTYKVLLNVKKKLRPEFAQRLTIINFEKNRGKRHAMAEGFRRAKGDIVVQLDSDSYIVPETFRELILPFADSEIGAVTAHAEPENAEKNFWTKMQAAYYFVSFRIMKAAECTFGLVLCCSGCSSSYRKSTVLPILDQWLGEKFLGLPVTWGDDRSLTSWVIRRGYKTTYVENAKAMTVVPENSKQLIKQQLRWKKSWIINSYLTSRFIFRADSFFAAAYFFPLAIITILTPFVAVSALIVSPLQGLWPLYYLIGLILINSLLVLYYRSLSPGNRFWPYFYAWTLFNTFFLSFLLFWAVIKIQDRGWGTR